jgi:CheY-like chemotaxis protein
VVQVADTGLGIDPVTLKRLFEPFAQADRSLDRSRGRLGLGLALVKGMVELHGGEVSAYSDGPGKGSRFTVKLPLVERAVAADGPAQPSDAASKGCRKVLIIEDNKDAADSLSEVLGLSGHRVAVAYDGAAGLVMAREFRPEIIICDIGLPGDMDGYAVARALRRDAVTASAFLIALTGYAQPEDRRQALAAGFDAHMAKPPSPEKLEEILGVLEVRS